MIKISVITFTKAQTQTSVKCRAKIFQNESSLYNSRQLLDGTECNVL